MYGICAFASEFLIGNSAVNYMTHYPEKASQIGDMILFGCSIVGPGTRGQEPGDREPGNPGTDGTFSDKFP
jgi:hypothetical protein